MLLSILLGFCLLSGAAPGQRYHVHTYDQSDGLPSSVVFDVLQDQDGRIWFATRSGVAVYDGAQWHSYGPEDGLSPPGQARLRMDASGTLWSAVRADVVRLFRFDGQRWHALEPRTAEGRVQGRIISMAVGSQEGMPRVALGTDRQGLWLWDGERWQRFGVAEGLEGPILGLAAAGARLWIGTRNGLFSLLDRRLERLDVELPESAVLGLTVERRATGTDRLWLAGEDWIGILEGGVFRLLREGLDLPFLRLHEGLELQPGPHGGLFFGNPLGLAWLDSAGELETLDLKSGLKTLGATSLHLDREGHLWIGGLRGITKIVSFRFATLTREHGLLEDEVSAVLERRSGQVVLGHNLGLTFLEVGGPQLLPLGDPASVPATRVLDLAEDEEGNLWVAGGYLGLCRVSPERRVRCTGEAEGLDMIASVRVDSRRRLWACSQERLYRLDGDRFVTVEADLPTKNLRRIFEGRDGTLYLVSSDSGAHACRETESPERRDCTPVPGLESEDVFSFVEDHQGRIWFGTTTGLFQLEEGGARQVIGGADTAWPVFFLVEDPQARLWLGTDDGVLRWDGEHLDPFTVEDGLSGRETNRAAGMVDSRGRLWIGTDAGVSLYRWQYDEHGLPPRLELTTATAGGRTRSLDEPMTLQPRDNDLLFRFRAISFRDEARLRFHSRLEGFEEDWLGPYTSPRRELRYTSLPPGEYRFHLRAASAEGLWSEVVSSAPILIAEPLWRRPWFLTTLSLLLTLTLFGAERAIAQWRYSRRLKQEVTERTAELARANRELEILSREKADFLAIAAHDLRVPLVNLRGFAAEVAVSLEDLEEALAPALKGLPEENQHQIQDLLREDLPEELAFIDSSAGRMDRLVTAILQLSRLERRELSLERIDMEALVSSVLESLAYRLEQHPATVEVGPLPAVTADAIALEQVFQNLLSNAVSYLESGRPGRIAIRGRRTAEEVIFEVEDNGRGIAEADRDKVFQIFGRAGLPGTDGEGMGLAYVRTLLRRHGGRVWFESEVGEGTVFHLSLPRRSQGSQTPAL